MSGFDRQTHRDGVRWAMKDFINLLHRIRIGGKEKLINILVFDW